MEPVGSDLQSTTRLLNRYRHGELSARDELFERYLPLLQRWARGRLPKHGRDLAEIDDLGRLGKSNSRRTRHVAAMPGN